MKIVRKTAAVLGLMLMLSGCGQTEEIKTQEESITDTDGTALVEVTWQTPELEGLLSGQALRTVEQYYSGLYQENQIGWKGELKEQAAQNRKQAGANFLSYHIEEQCEIAADTEHYLSIRRSVTQYTGGSQEGIYLYGETFRKTDGSLLLLSDLFQTETDGADILTQEISRQIQENHSVDYYENAAEQAEIGLEDNITYYFTEDQLVLVYQAGELAPYAAGPQSFSVPWSDLQDVLAEEYYELTEK